LDAYLWELHADKRHKLFGQLIEAKVAQEKDLRGACHLIRSGRDVEGAYEIYEREREKAKLSEVM
jgi:hypothetical protein